MPAVRHPREERGPGAVQDPADARPGRDPLRVAHDLPSDFHGRPADAQPTWQGYSIGRWDGDTLVVETAGFNGKTWLDMAGHPATAALRVTERFTRRTVGRMDVEITIDDPRAYTRPWTVKQGVRLLPEDELIEHICEENNKAPAHVYGR